MTGSVSAFAFGWRGAVLAAVVMSFPLMVRGHWLSAGGVDISLNRPPERAGRRALARFLTITWPLTPAGYYCWYGAGVRPFGEFWRLIITLLQYSGRPRTISAMYMDSDARRGRARRREAVRDFDCG